MSCQVPVTLLPNSNLQTTKSENMSSKIYSLGLIGYPLGHSLSPQIHGAALHALGLSGEYCLYPIPPLPDGQVELAALLDRVRFGEVHGLNVTIPHKQNVISLLDKLAPAAQTIGAVNTIFLRDGVLIGDNTDAPGFWGDLQRFAASDQRSAISVPRSALVLGSGGGARAVIYALLAHGYQVTISARCEDQTQAEMLRDDLSAVSDQIEIICLETDYGTLNSDHFSLIVNCTPVGMHPLENASPWQDEIPFPKNVAVYDLVYNPRETQFVRQARAAGLPATTGLGMLVEQAALAFERWIGLRAPRDVMRAAVNL
jgi:shikimate dehydrogenase